MSRSRPHDVLAPLAALGLLSASGGFAAAQEPRTPAPPAELSRPSPEAIKAGADTRGGVAPGARLIHVTNLHDAGPGSLRAALAVDGPRVIVFDVGGRIKLESDLKIAKPFVTIAGQTAPSPGITLWGASLRVRSHDVVIQHIAVRAGAAATAAENDNRDAISIDGSARAPLDHQSFQVRLENVSASWSVDETISLWYATTHSVTLRHSIIAEALKNAGHPKGQHSMGLLIGQNVQSAEISGNLMISNSFRNPAVGRGASAIIANNYIYNPGENAIHFYKVKSDQPTRATVLDNVIEAGPDTKPNLSAIIVPLGREPTLDDRVLVADNAASLPSKGKALSFSSLMNPAIPAPVVGQIPVLPVDEVKADVLKYAGSRPADRDPIDQRLVRQVSDGTARIVSSPPEWASAPPRPTHRRAKPPRRPFETEPGSARTRLEAWLCDQSLAVGGAPSAECPARSTKDGQAPL